MVAFPLDVSFLCRRCKGSFLVRSDNFAAARRASDILCPNCGAGAKISPAKMDAFFRFYPRFVAALGQMAAAGFPLVAYGIDKHEIVNIYSLLTLTFQCRECGQKQRLPITRAREIAAHPKLFFCQQCRHRPTSTLVVKELFTRAINLVEITDRFSSLQWNIFEPYGFDLEWIEL